MPISPNIPQCTHVKLNGVRCGSPALKGKTLCYFHFRARDRHEKYIPFLEDGNALQFALMQIIRGVMDDRIDLKKANTLLYALQIAASNLRQVNAEPYWERVIRQFPWNDLLKKRIQRAEALAHDPRPTTRDQSTMSLDSDADPSPRPRSG